MRIAIIGSAGRAEDLHEVNKSRFLAMVARAQEIIEDEWGLKPEEVHLVSGAAGKYRW